MTTECTHVPASPRRKWLLGCVVLAVLYQAILVATSPAVADDSVTFVALAKMLRQDPVGTMRQADQHPGFPAMILAGRWVVTPLVNADSVFSWIWGGRLAAGLFGILTLVVLWHLAKTTFDEQVAAISVLIVTVLPLFRQNAVDVLSDTPHLFFYVLAVWLAAEGMTRRGWLWFLGAGAAGGLAFWIRPEGLSVVAVTAAVLPFWAWRRRSMKPLAVLVCIVVMVAAAAAVTVPYLVLSGKITSKTTHKEYPFASPDEPDAPAVGRPAATPPSPPETAPAAETRTLPQILAAAAVELGQELVQSMRYVLVLPLLVGVFLPRPSASGRTPRVLIAALILLHVVLLFWLYYAGGYISQRHIMPTVLLVMPWVAIGMQAGARWAVWLMPRRKGADLDLRRRWVLGILLVALAVALTPRTLRRLHATAVPVVETSIALKVVARPGDQVLSNSVLVPFYSQLPGRVITSHETDLSGVGLPYRFVVLTLKPDEFREEWLTQLSSRYEPLEVLGVPQKGVRVFRLSAASPQRH